MDATKPAVTPASRFAWEDVLGKPKGREEDEELFSSERLLWCNDYNANYPVANSPLIPRKDRKRARSSSPLSSPASKRATPPKVDAKTLAQVLTTPRADPASDLWDRFSLPARDATSPSGLTHPLLAQLLVSSSPRPPNYGSGPAADRVLRKSNSCSSHWPKRRKIERADSDRGDTAAGNTHADPKSFMVSTLLETVDDELKKSTSGKPKAPQPPKSPSPRKTSVQSPTKQSPARAQPESSPLAKKSTRGDPGANSIAQAAPGTKASSDYGDDDLDDETFMALDASIHPAQGDESTLVVSSGEVDRDTPAPKAFEDDFGDLDDDFFNVAANLVAEVEAKHIIGSQSQGQRHDRRPAPDYGGEDDAHRDEFGDFDFDDVELAVTQASPHTLSPNVCV